MLNKKTIKNILLEVESSYYNYEKYLNEIIGRVLNKDEDLKYLIAREYQYNGYLTLYKYSESDYIQWLYNNKNNILNIVLNSLALNIRNYANNEYLINEYNLNKKLYSELKKIQKEG